MTLFVEIAAGREPVLYRSKKRLYLVPAKYLLKCYVFACKAHALQQLKKHPKHYEFAPFIERALRELPVIEQVHHVERRRARKRVKYQILSKQTAEPIAPEQQGDYDHERE